MNLEFRIQNLEFRSYFCNTKQVHKINYTFSQTESLILYPSHQIMLGLRS